MGIGSTDFTVPEKVRLGWLRPVAQTPRPGTYRITRADRSSTRPALRIPTALGSYWLTRARYADAVAWTDRVLSLPGADTHPELRIRALTIKA